MCWPLPLSVPPLPSLSLLSPLLPRPAGCPFFCRYWCRLIWEAISPNAIAHIHPSFHPSVRFRSMFSHNKRHERNDTGMFPEHAQIHPDLAQKSIQQATKPAKSETSGKERRTRKTKKKFTNQMCATKSGCNWKGIAASIGSHKTGANTHENSKW